MLLFSFTRHVDLNRSHQPYPPPARRLWLCALSRVLSITVLGISLCASLLPNFAQAFQVLPRISDMDRKLSDLGKTTWYRSFELWGMDKGLPMLKHPVHEAITLQALGCGADNSQEINCVTPHAVRQHQALLYGVRWPDDPPFPLSRQSPPRLKDCNPSVTLRSTSQPLCWYGLFQDAAKTAQRKLRQHPDAQAFGPGDYLLYRSHFGDLQFFHAMATQDNERAIVTQQRMKVWAEFLWGIAIGTLPKDRYIRDLAEGSLSSMGDYFPGDMAPINLLATGIVEVRKHLDQVAMGTLLHMVQDSFSQAHAERAPESGVMCRDIPRFAQPGKIQRFYSYAGQQGSLHDHEDTFEALGLQTLQSSPHVVDVSHAFLSLWQEQAPWPTVAKYFDCVFAIENFMAPAGPGEAFRHP